MGYLYTILNRIFGTTIEAAGSHATLSLGGVMFLGFPVAAWMGAYGYAIATKHDIVTGWAVLIGLGLVLVAATMFMFLYARLSEDSFAVVTLAAMLAVEALLYSWDTLTGGVLGIAGVPRIFNGQTLADLTIMTFAVTAPLFVLYWLILESPFGRSLRALKENQPALTSLGTSPVRVGQFVVLLSCIFSGIVAILGVTRIQFLDPTFVGVPTLIQILTIAILTTSPKVLQLLGVSVLIVLLPEVLRGMDLPVSVLGHLRSLLYSAVLIILLYYSITKTTVKRYV